MNPFLPLWEYTPDGEPHIFGDRIYLFGSHDTEGGVRYCSKGDYVGWSAPLDDLSDWRYEGVMYSAEQDPHTRPGVTDLYAPDVVQGKDDRYYLYYTLSGTAALYLTYHGEGPADCCKSVLKRCNPRFRDIFPQKTADFSGQQIKPSRHAFVLQYVIQCAILKLRKVVLCMATKTSNVTARVEPEVKEQAETILSDLGIPVSTAINIFYRQIVLWNGLPFRPSVPAARPKSRSEMNDAEFNARMSAGYAQAKQNQAAPSDEVFDRLIGEIQNGKAV